MLVSGELVSFEVYIQEIGFSEKIFEAAKKTENSAFEQVSDEDAPKMYIHLRNAHFIVPGAHHAPNGKGVLWRGRMSEISGFNLGRMSATAS